MSFKVSICIPNYNNAEFIKECIESCLSQNYENLEIIIIDDCSTDNSLEIIKQFQDPRIKLFKNQINIGRLKNINQCFKKASGELVTILPSDCCLNLNSSIKERVEMFIKNQDLVMVFSGVRLIDEKGRIIGEKIPFSQNIIESSDNFFRILSRGNIIYTGSNLIKKEALKKINFFPENLSVSGSRDWYAWLKLTLLGRVGYISKPLFCERIHSRNITSLQEKSLEIAENEYLILKKIFNNLPPSKKYLEEEKILAFQSFLEHLIIKAFSSSLNGDLKLALSYLDFIKKTLSSYNKIRYQVFMLGVYPTFLFSPILKFITKKQLISLRKKFMPLSFNREK